MKHLDRQAKQRLHALLLRHGKAHSREQKWYRLHFHWLENVIIDQPVQQTMFQDYFDTPHVLTRRTEALRV